MQSVAAPQSLLRKLEWRVRHTADSLLGGEYRSTFRGRGREFDQVVKYEFGDDVRDIDWNVTARLGEPYRKKFVEERELTTVLLFEDSLSLQFGSGRRTKRNTALEMAGSFALLCAGNRDRAGFWHATPSTHLMREPVRAAPVSSKRRPVCSANRCESWRRAVRSRSTGSSSITSSLATVSCCGSATSRPPASTRMGGTHAPVSGVWNPSRRFLGARTAAQRLHDGCGSRQ